MFKPIEFIGKVSLFAWQVLYDVFRPPFEAAQIARQIAQAGSDSLPLVIASGFALGIKTIQELLRHSNYKVTADTYTQAVTSTKRAAQTKLVKMILLPR